MFKIRIVGAIEPEKLTRFMPVLKSALVRLILIFEPPRYLIHALILLCEQ